MRCIDVEVARLRKAQWRFGCDHRGVFATTYLELTKTLRRVLHERPDFLRYPRYLYVEDALSPTSISAPFDETAGASLSRRRGGSRSTPPGRRI